MIIPTQQSHQIIVFAGLICCATVWYTCGEHGNPRIMTLDHVDFSQIVAFTDLHLGYKNNSKQHNDWCVQFVDWMIAQAQQKNIRTCVFLGDWSHNRSSVNVVTLNYSLECLRKLSAAFDDVIMLLGNHDLYFRDKLEIHSIPYVTEFANIHLISKPTVTGDIAFVPWLVGDEWKQISQIRKPYMFCHAEIARFKLNGNIEMPDHGGLSARHFEHQKLVVSGHFHKRQRKDHILYMGNAFPHNYADAGDDQRGCMFWSPGSEPEFQAWPDAPRYRVMELSTVLMDPGAYIDHRTFARIIQDVDMCYEDAHFLRELFEQQLNALDVSFVNNRNNMADVEFNDDEVSFESVDTIVLSHLATIESTSMDKNLLAQIYQSI